ncbi:MAG TPA: dienelactone hydrolase family protein [Flavobacterium sp.]|nr:dienelactone hydrolase family protein [Flavobacterium sp.]
MDQSLYYLVQEPEVVLESNPVLILLHGFGSNEEDLFSFASELPKNYYIISVRAPKPLAPYGYAWFDIQFDAYGNKITNDEEAWLAKNLVIDFINEVVNKYPIDKDNVNLIGFSQGAILSYAVALTQPKLVNKVVALSGYFKKDLIKDYLPQEEYKHLKFFISHGTVDQVISIEDARKISPILTELGITHTYKEYPVGHGVAPQNFYDLRKFIEEN